MGTKNPKISAYVPQEVFDRFQEFQKERGFSMSKAVTAIFCDYFDIKETTSSLPSGITLAQFQDLATRLAQLEDKFENQPIYQNAALLPVEPHAVSGSGEVPQLSAEIEKVKSYDEKPSLPLSYPDSELQKITSEPSKTLEATFFSVDELADRFGFKTGQSVTNARNKLKSTQKFIEWSTKKDPDGHGWKYRQLESGSFEYFLSS